MKLSAAIVSIAALLSSADACKCLSGTSNIIDITRHCCRVSGGATDGADDCPAGQISYQLPLFAQCCARYSTKSNCRCPIGCALGELEAQHQAEGKAPPADEEVNEI